MDIYMKLKRNLAMMGQGMELLFTIKTQRGPGYRQQHQSFWDTTFKFSET